ncbi:MAG: polysaccharide deacetylase family protein [Candidatus Omnitrophota bacterium]
MKKYVLIIATIIIIGIICSFKQQDIYRFPRLKGPNEKTIVIKKIPALISLYENGGENRFAILLTKRESCWLGLAHGLKSIGVPFIITEDYKIALKHKVVLVYPEISGSVLSSEALSALAEYPRNGGILIGENVLGGLQDVFGVTEAAPGRNRFEIRWSDIAARSLKLTDDREKILSLGIKEKIKETIGTYGYRTDFPIAKYEDGSAAITERKIGRGYACAVGLDLGDFFLRGYNNREEWIARSYVNGYEPDIDVLLRWLRYAYIQGEDNAVTISPVPENKKLAVIITHDIDFSDWSHISDYVEYEKSAGLHVTYFVQTKYIKDWNDYIFFNKKNSHFLKIIVDKGMEVGSHTVSHSKMFNKFSIGTGMERYPEYVPFVQEDNEVRGGSVLGELRVSKFLLEEIGNAKVESFRPGGLRIPNFLPQALESVGYKYSSSVTANNSLTHLPFELNYSRETDSETNIFEFPITIEDTTVPVLLNMLPQAIELSKKIAANKGLFVILIHPNEISKLEFEKKLVDTIEEYSWFGSVSDYGSWWSARNKVDIDVGKENGRVIKAVLNAPDEIEGLTLEIPNTWKFKDVKPNIMVSSDDGTVTLGKFKGTIELNFMNLRQ